MRLGDCEYCAGFRLNIRCAQHFFDTLELSPEERGIADKVLDEIRQRCKFLNDVGLEYLTLDRLSATLSGGEAQRIQLATCLGSRLVGAVYVLDEPSIGLHNRDTARLIKILQDLKDLGNTIIVVEHDPEIMAEADYILDLGPGAGENGGRIIFAGTYTNCCNRRLRSPAVIYVANWLFPGAWSAEKLIQTQGFIFRSACQ